MRNTIIPLSQYRFGSQDSLDFAAICEFMSLGYFLGEKTYFKNSKQVLPATDFQIRNNQVLSSSEYFKWHYSPEEKPFNDIYDEFVCILESYVQNTSEDVVIPISGGLDSRTLVLAAIKRKKNISSYGYQFEHGWEETKYGMRMARYFGFPFDKYTVKNGVLWDYINDLSLRNACYSEFTHVRQFAFYKELKSRYNGTFLLGHGGDLFFDHMSVSENLSPALQSEEILTRMVKFSGKELAEKLWKNWDMSGSFDDYIRSRVSEAYRSIEIDNVNAHFRAFKSKFYVPRWTCVNLEIFSDFGPVCLPYFGDEMCKFICRVPESVLAGRKLQIEYIRRNSPFLAKLEWESNKPFNLLNYHRNRIPYNLPYRMFQRARRSVARDKYIQRNWELQFLGKENLLHLQNEIYFLSEQIDTKILKGIVNNFKMDPFKNFHAITMLLTLSKFFQNLNELKK